MKLYLPPLRKRKEDIPLLVDYFIRKFNNLNATDIEGLAPEVLGYLMAHDFPGNVRELENAVEYATLVCKDRFIGSAHLPENIRPPADSRRVAPLDPQQPPPVGLDDMERTFIYSALKHNQWNRTATAAQLGIHPTTLWRKIKRLDLRVPSQDGRSRKSD